MPDFCAHELLSLHELVSGTALHARTLKVEMAGIKDAELKMIAQNSLKGKREFIDQVASVLQ